MEENKEATSGASSSASGEEQKEEKKYDASFVEKLKKEKENWAKSASEAQSQLEELQNKLTEIEKEKMMSNEQYKEYAEKLESQLKEREQELGKYKETIKQGQVNRKIQDELVRNGLNPKYMDDALRLVDRQQVSFHPETQTVLGVEDLVRDFKDRYKDLGFFGKTVPGVDYSAANSKPEGQKTIGEMSIQEKLKMLSQTKR